jgi:regulatory protein YycH of two-component signal transduction system YycFG
LVVLFHVVDVSEFNLVILTIFIIMSWVSSEAAWFHKEHDWDQNDNNNEQNNQIQNSGTDDVMNKR